MAELSIKERLEADTPTFFKITQLIGILMMLVAGIMLLYHTPISAIIVSNIGVCGSVLAIFSPFVAKDANLLIDKGVTMENINTVVTDLITQYNNSKAITDKPFTPEPLSDTINSLRDTAKDLGVQIPQAAIDDVNKVIQAQQTQSGLGLAQSASQSIAPTITPTPSTAPVIN